MRNDFESNYLAHHGILGQKWGKKNGPPYPLGASDHSASEKKAGWRKSLSKEERKEEKRKKLSREYSSEWGKLDAKSKEYKEKLVKKKTGLSVEEARSQGYQKEVSKADQKTRNKFDKKFQAVNKDYIQREEVLDGKRLLTDKQKKAIKVGAAVAVTALAAYGAYKVSKDPRVKALVNVGKVSAKEAMLRNKAKLSSIDLSASDKRIADAIKSANNAVKSVNANKTARAAMQLSNKPMSLPSDETIRKYAANPEAAKQLMRLKETVEKAQSLPSDETIRKYAANPEAVEALMRTKERVSKEITSTPTLTFGASTQKFTKADADRLSEISNNLLREAQKRNGIATSNTTSFDYAKELVKKNRKTLSQYTMQDLKDLDLY